MKRHGRTILCGGGITATERMEGNLPALSVRKDGRRIGWYRGSSLRFSAPLTAGDKDFLEALIAAYR